MKYGLLVAYLLYSMSTTWAQLTVDFSTNQYPFEPTWHGHTYAFGLEEDSLLSSQTIRTTYLSTPNTMAMGTVWEIGIQLDFNPSPSNRLRIYLVSDTDRLNAPLNGYFVQIGETGDTDRYHLYKQSGEHIQLLLSSTPKERTNPTQVRDRVRIIRDSLGTWELYTAIDMTDAFTSEGIVTDTDYIHTSFFGVQCLFTAANSDKFGFRYFMIDTADAVIGPPPTPDTKLMPNDTAGTYFYEDFSNGIGDHWLGDTTSVRLVGERLKLDTLAASPTTVYTSNNGVRNTVWEAGIDINGALSASNFVRLHLAASDDPRRSHQGYHLQIDGSRGNHTYRLWRQNGGTRSTVFRSTPILNQDGKFRARIRIICDIDGRWQILADEYDSGTFETLIDVNGESTATDQTYTANNYMGYQLNFTPTRREDFKLDYILVRQYEEIVVLPDPLRVDSLMVMNDTTLSLVFDRVVDTFTGSDPASYSLNNGYGHPVSTQVVDSVVALTFMPPFISGNYVLSIENVTDTNGIALEPGTAVPFSYIAPSLPDTKLMPDDTTGAYFYEGFGDGIGGHWLGETESFESVNERLKLNPLAASPTAIYTTNDRVRNTVWEAGIDINGALSASNFVRLYLAASDDPRGSHQGYHLQIDGSRGNHTYRLWRQNGGTRSTVFQSTPIPNQNGKFRARIRVICDINGEWQVLTDEYDSGTFEVLTNTEGDSIVVDQTHTESIYLGYQPSFTTTRREDFKLDYILIRKHEDIATPPDILSGEILINEILFNPKPNGVEFVELYNHSEKTFDLQMLYLANVNNSGQIAAHRQVATRHTLFHPHTYIVLTTDPETVKHHYPNAVEHTFVQMPSLPAFPNSGGSAVIVSGGRTIDSLTYSASMHSDFIVDEKGVSLEREAFHIPTNAIGNFRSASTAIGGATPGYQNSQADMSGQQEGLFLTSRTFSPDDDGFEDLLEINYQFTHGGMMANIDIYSDKGVLVRRLVRNQSLATSGVIEWDGTTDGGRRLPVGIYVALIEIYHASEPKKLYRKSFVLAERF